MDVANAMMIGNIGVCDAPEAAFASFALCTTRELGVGSKYASKNTQTLLDRRELTCKIFQEAEKRGRTRQEISKIDAQTAVLETQRKSEKAQADAEVIFCVSITTVHELTSFPARNDANEAGHGHQFGEDPSNSQCGS